MLSDVSSVAAKQKPQKQSKTCSLIAMWLKSTAWISPIKTKGAEASFCHREQKKKRKVTRSFFFFICVVSFSSTRKVSQKNVAAQEADFVRADSVTAVTKLWQLLLSFVYFDGATPKALAPLSRWTNLHKREVESVMLFRC